MVDWIVRNKEWLFSGAGVTLILVVGGLLYQRLWGSRRPQTTPKGIPISVVLQPTPAVPTSPPGLPEAVDLRPRDIVKAISNVALLQQPDVKKHYLGLRVSWEGTLASADKVARDKVKLQIGTGEIPDRIFVFVEVKTSDYPGLGLLKKGDSVQVTGAISKIETMWIELSDAGISFKVS